MRQMHLTLQNTPPTACV